LAGLRASSRRPEGAGPQPQGEPITDEPVLKELARALAIHNDDAGSAARIERLLVMSRPADLDASEITDKCYVNQRQVLARRAALVELLYTQPVPAGVVVAERTA